MNYRKIDIATWPRRDLYTLYTTDLKIVMNMTVKVDVTRLVAYARERGMKFYPVMMHTVGRVLNAHDEFKYSLTPEGELILFDSISPSYTDFNPETENFVKFVTEYTPDLTEFYRRTEADRQKYRNACGFIPDQPKNVYDISCLPWTNYESLTLHVESTDARLFPVVIWGKYEEVDGRLILPVTADVNHAVCDGFHLSRFFRELGELIDAL